MSLRDFEASQKQYDLLEKLGYEIPEGGISSGEASAIIKQLLKNKPKDITDNYRPETSTVASSVSKGPAVGVTNDKKFNNSNEWRSPLQLIRLDCLKAAVDMFKERYEELASNHSELIIKTAEEFEKWVFRDGK